MWLFDAVASAFTAPVPERSVQVFRIIFGIACLMKFSTLIMQNDLGRLNPAGYQFYKLRARRGEKAAARISRSHTTVAVLRTFAAAWVVIGPWPRIAVLVVLVGLVFELNYDYRFNTIFLLLVGCCLLLAGAVGSGLVLSDVHSSKNTWAQFLIVVTTVHMYLNSAWIKARSPHFRTGLWLHQFFSFGPKVRQRLPRWEFWYPRAMVTSLGADTQQAAAVWRLAAVATIGLEASLPALLLVPATHPYAVAVGVAMHVCFAALLPLQLAHFSLAVAGTYILFTV